MKKSRNKAINKAALIYINVRRYLLYLRHENKYTIRDEKAAQWECTLVYEAIRYLATGFIHRDYPDDICEDDVSAMSDVIEHRLIISGLNDVTYDELEFYNLNPETGVVEIAVMDKLYVDEDKTEEYM